jgi:two-component system, NarL family, sensor kinase
MSRDAREPFPGVLTSRPPATQNDEVPPVLVAAEAAVPFAAGVLLAVRQPRRPFGWLLIAHALVFFAALAFDGPSTTRAGLVADQLTAGSWVFLFLFLALAAYLLPDGRPLNRFWRWWIRAGLAGVVVFLIGAAGDADGFAAGHDGARLPVPWLPPAVSGILGLLGLVLVAALLGGSVVAVWRRLRRSTGDARLQLLWLAWGALTVPGTLLLGWVNHFLLGDGPLFPAALGLAAAGLPVTIAVAVLRHRLFDIRVVLSRTLVYLLLTTAVVAVYGLALLAAGRLAGNGTAGGLVAVAVVAVTVHPAYAFLRTRVERWVYGLRSDPRAAIRLLADRAEAADPDGLVAAVTEAVASALRVPAVRVETVAGPSTTPMVHRGRPVGHLAVDVPPGRELSAADHELIRDLARYAAILVRAEQLNEELRESRSAIVTAREEERRRLRRDLHDGLGPSLAAVVLTLNAAQTRADPALLTEARDEVKDAIAEVRRLVDDLRPPAIDEVGLLGAIRQRAASLSSTVTFEVDGPDGLPVLPAAVEVAAFRIASEAMTNVVRHSGATRCRVGVDVDGSFALTVADNGRGAAGAVTPGVGWASMRERAAELGGSCTIISPPDSGLVVRAVLPLAQEAM